MKYVFGRGNWLESIAVGIISAVVCVILAPFMFVIAALFFVLGVTGFLKREE